MAFSILERAGSLALMVTDGMPPQWQGHMPFAV